MYNNRYITELPINEVKEYYGILRKKRKLTHEEIEDLGICQERLIEYAFEIRQQQDTEIIRLLQEISSKLDKKNDRGCHNTMMKERNPND